MKWVYQKSSETPINRHYTGQKAARAGTDVGVGVRVGIGVWVGTGVLDGLGVEVGGIGVEVGIILWITFP